MKTSEIKAFASRVENAPLGITESEIEAVQPSINELWSRKWVRFHNHPETGKLAYAPQFGLIMVGIAAPLTGLTMIGIVGPLFFSMPFPSERQWFGALVFAAKMIIPSIAALKFLTTFSSKAYAIDDVHAGLAVLSDGLDCQKVLDLSEAVPAARRIRSELLAAGRPIRRMHLRAMEKLDTTNVLGQLAAKRRAEWSAAACKEAHGVHA